ncbi:MAG: hypothetical protein HYV34_00790 [Candidatus Kerfeldbacteria bacterium]|nr:hypothetical protein [Candidatus Kerfeldbacteria bacterium]
MGRIRKVLIGEKSDTALRITRLTVTLAVIFGLSAVGLALFQTTRTSPQKRFEQELTANYVLPPTRDGRSVFGGWKDVAVKPTYRFRIGKVQGRDTFIDPLGYPMYARAVLDVNWDNLTDEARATYFNNVEMDWAKMTIPKVYEWGFNAIGYVDPTDEILLDPTVMKVSYFGLFDNLADWGNDMPNPWDPAWIAEVDKRAQEYTAVTKGDPFHMAAITVYEPPIDFLSADASSIHPNSGWFYTMMEAPSGSPAKVAFEESMKKQHKTIESFNTTYSTDYTEFGALQNTDIGLYKGYENVDSEEERNNVPQVVEDVNVYLADIIGEYQRVIYQALKKYDPSIVVGGPALSGESAYTPEILQAIAANADFLGVNSSSDEGFDEAYVLKLAEEADLPVLQTRFTVAQEPCTVDTLGRSFPSVPEQENRAEAYFDTVNEALVYTNVLGNNWGEWIDQDTSANPSAPCEYANFGLYARTGQRYKKLFDRGTELWAEKLFEEMLWGRDHKTEYTSPYERPTPTIPGIPPTAPAPRDFYPSHPIEAPGKDADRIDELTFPQTEAIIFYGTNESEQCIDTLASFDYLRFGFIGSSAKQGDGGVNLGKRSGIGNWAGTQYNFNNINGGQKLILDAKALNPDLNVYSHAGLRNVESNWADYSETYPRRWFFDALSPRWFAYTLLVPLQKSVDNESTVFEFKAEDIENMRRLGAKSAEELGLSATRWNKKAESLYTYFQGFDNNQGSGSGTTEMMAIGKIVIDGDRGTIHTLTRGRKMSGGEGDEGGGVNVQSRTVWGKPNTNTYSAGARFGLLSNADKGSYGTNAFAMNMVCANPENTSAFCQEVNAGGSWTEHVVGYVRDILIPSRAGDVYLNNGITFDADANRDWRSYSFKFTGTEQKEQQLDMDGDGVADVIDMLSASLFGVYDSAATRISEEARRQGRNDFFSVMNGALATERESEQVVYGEWNISGREWEQFYNRFTDNGTQDAIDQYRRLYSGLVDRDHPLALLTSRERTSIENEGKINLKDFRSVAAIGLVFGNGAIGVTGDYTSGFAACGKTDEPDTWMDYFSVDDQGYASTHASYTGATRHENRHWLGKALGEGEQIAGLNNTFKRKFENGEAYYSAPGGTIQLETPMNKVCGTDPVNDCSKNIPSVTLEPEDGIILLYP